MTIGGGRPLTRFFAIFYTITSLTAAAIQTFVTPRVLSGPGLAAAVGSLPLAVTAGGAGVLMAFDLTGLTLLRGLEVVLRGSLFRSGYELFYTPVAAADKRTVKGIIDVGGERLGDALGSGIVALLLWSHWSGRLTLLGAAIGFACAGLVMARRLGRSYVRALETSLASQSKGMSGGSGTVGLDDSMVVPSSELMDEALAKEPEHVAILEQHPQVRELLDLRSSDENRVILTLARIEIPDPLICPQLLRLLANDAFAFLAMDKLRRVASRSAGQMADALLDPEESFAVRRRIPLLLAGSESQRALDALVEALSDVEFQIRFRSAHAIGQLRTAHPRLFLNTEKVWTVLTAELEVSREVWESHRLMSSEAIGDDSETPGEASLEYLFALLRLILPPEPVSMAYRALHTEDRHLRGTALEYLQTVLPANTWKRLNGLIAGRIARPGA